MTVDPRLKELQDALSSIASTIVVEVLTQERKHAFQSLNSQLDRELADVIVARIKKLLPSAEAGREQ